MRKSITIILFLLIILPIQVSAVAVRPNIENIAMFMGLENDTISGSTAYDWTGINNGTITGATCGVNGIYGAACDFELSDASDVITIPNHASTSGTNLQGLSYWMKPESVGATGRIFSNEDTVNDRGYTSALWVSGGAKSLWQAGTNAGWPSYSITNGSVAFTPTNWYHVFIDIDNGDGHTDIYIDNVLYASAPYTTGIFASTLDLTIGKYTAGTAWFDGIIDELHIFNGTDTNDFNASHGEYLYNGGAPGRLQQPPYTINWEITAKDNYTAASLTNFSIEVVGNDNYSTTNGTIITDIDPNNGSLFTVVFSSDENNGYANLTVTNLPSTQAAVISAFKLYRLYTADTTGNITLNDTINYARNLTYTLNISCPDYIDASVMQLVNDTLTSDTQITCNNESGVIHTGYYQHTIESNFSLNLTLNTSSAGNNISLLYDEFAADLNNPVVTLINVSVGTGFSDPTGDSYMTCNDSVMPYLEYLHVVNGLNTTLVNLTTLTEQQIAVNLTDGANNITAICSDHLSSTTEEINTTVFFKLFSLIDEVDNTAFDVANITSVRLYYDDNSSYYDFKSNSTSQVNFTGEDGDKMRFEFVYASGDTITRYVDIGLLESDAPRICVNKEGITHYEQFIVSSLPKEVVLISLFSDCIITADYTRFAYQDALLLKAYSINTQYYLYTVDGGSRVFLASVDGSVAASINLDTLEFVSTAYDINVLSDAVSFERSGSTTVQIHYRNLNNDNTDLDVTITRLDTNTEVFSTSSFNNFNNFTVYFDYSTLSNVTNSTLFQLTIDKTTAEGESSINRYFNTNFATGVINNAVAIGLSILLMLGGMTFTATRTALGWFGIIMSVASIAVLSLAIGSAATIFIIMLNLTNIAFVSIILFNSNQQVLT